MLENEIKALTAAIEKMNVNVEILNLNLESLGYAKAKAKAVEPKPKAKAEPKPKPKAKAEPKPKAKAEPKAEAESVSLDELQRYVLGVVREKRHLKDAIKELVNATGAKFMGDVPAEKAGKLKASIEKLVAGEVMKND